MSKKRLSVIDLLVSREFRVLSDLENRMIVAGSGTWDCTFNQFIQYMSTIGCSVDKNTLISQYCSYSKLSQEQLEAAGGVSYDDFICFIDKKYQISMEELDLSTIDTFASNNALAIYTDVENIWHTVTPLSAGKITMNGEEVYGIWVWDPSKENPKERQYFVPNESVAKLYHYNPTEDFGKPGYYGCGGYGY